MKAVLEFLLPDEESEFKEIINARDTNLEIKDSLRQCYQNYRNYVKYGLPSEDPQVLMELVYREFCEQFMNYIE